MDYTRYHGLAITVERDIARVVIQFDRGEEQENYQDQRRELTEIWRDLEADDAVKAVVITGGWDDEFYLTGQPPGLAPPREDHEAMWNLTLFMESDVGRIVRDLINFSKPLIAAVNGPASGVGLTVVLLADISVMAQDAWLFDPHVMLGMSAGDGAGGLLPLFTGVSKAKLYLMTSDALNGAEADRIGLVSRSVPRDEVLPLANDYAERLAGLPPAAVRFTKRGINQWLRLAEVVSQDYALMLEVVSQYSGERAGNPHTAWPPRIVP